MAVVVVYAVLAAAEVAGGDVDFTADYGLYSRGLCRLVKGHGAVHNAVVSYGDSLLAKPRRLGGKAVNPAGPVKQAVFAMDMQMYK